MVISKLRRLSCPSGKLMVVVLARFNSLISEKLTALITLSETKRLWHYIMHNVTKCFADEHNPHNWRLHEEFGAHSIGQKWGKTGGHSEEVRRIYSINTKWELLVFYNRQHPNEAGKQLSITKPTEKAGQIKETIKSTRSCDNPNLAQGTNKKKKDAKVVRRRATTEIEKDLSGPSIRQHFAFWRAVLSHYLLFAFASHWIAWSWWYQRPWPTLLQISP